MPHPQAPTPPHPHHLRAHSSPASLQQTYASARLSQGDLHHHHHGRQHSYDALDDGLGPLPAGWQKAVTSQGQVYFLEWVSILYSIDQNSIFWIIWESNSVQKWKCFKGRISIYSDWNLLSCSALFEVRGSLFKCKDHRIKKSTVGALHYELNPLMHNEAKYDIWI
jgi:hypothetical protein